MAKSIESTREPIDITEVESFLNSAAGASADATASFRDLRALFEAIVAASSAGSLAARLANFGMVVCEEKECFHSDHQTAFESQAEAFVDDVERLAGVRNA